VLIETALAAAVAGGVFYGQPLAQRALWRVAAQRRCAGRRLLVLTYDDGPGERTTPGLLELLADHDARATFFLLGRRAAKRPELVRAIVKQGHDVGCHSQEHLHSWKSPPWRSTRDALAGARTIASLAGPPRLFRPPYGKTHLATTLTVAFRGLRCCWWTHDGGDTRPALPEPGALARAIERAGGGVALLHDFDRPHPFTEERRRYVLEATEALLTMAHRRGLAVVTLSQALQRRTEGAR